MVWQGKSVVTITTPHACQRRFCGCIGYPTDPSTTFTFDCMINRSQASPHQQGFESFAGRQRFIGTTLSRLQGHGDLGVPAAGNLHPMVSPVTIGAGQSLTPFLKGGVSTAALHWSKATAPVRLQHGRSGFAGIPPKHPATKLENRYSCQNYQTSTIDQSSMHESFIIGRSSMYQCWRLFVIFKTRHIINSSYQ